MQRRDFVRAGCLSLTTMAFPQTKAAPRAPKALVFDTFGTVVDWRGSITAEGARWGQAKGIDVDWGRFADRWRAGYGPSMDKVRKGELRWTKLDDLHRMVLDSLLPEFKITGLTEQEKEDWNRVWHRLKPWPDSVAGLTRLKKKFTIAPLSNGNVALLTDMGKNAGLPWDAILSAELFHHYKPDPEVYLGAAEILGLKPGEVMMAAAHSGDLKAARNLGLQTGFIYRPDEYGPRGKADQAAPDDFDLVSANIIDLASKLGGLTKPGWFVAHGMDDRCRTLPACFKAALVVSALLCCACNELNPPRPRPRVVVWTQVGTWSGRGSAQTGTFEMGMDQWRVRWQTVNQTAGENRQVRSHCQQRRERAAAVAAGRA